MIGKIFGNKKVISLIAGLVMLGTTSYAGQNTIFGGNIDHGGFGGGFAKWTKINEKDAVLAGGRGGWIIDHSIAIGGSGCGLVNEINTTIKNSDGTTKEVALDMGYGGLFVQLIGLSDEIIHFNLDCSVGAGNISYKEKNTYKSLSESPGDTFFVVEPELDLVFNVAEFFRITVGGGYRFTKGAELGEFNDKNLSGPTGKISFNFGKF